MLSAIVILFTVVLLILCLHVYARCFLSRRRRRNQHSRRRRRPRIIFAADLSPGPSAGRGLDPSILSSLPTFPFSSFSSHHHRPDDEGLDCAVCLSEFRPSDNARLLPKCGHAFHVECIDMWFHSHDTCPLCRLPVRAPAFDNDQPIQVVIHTSEDNNNNSNSNNNGDDDDGGAPSSSSSSSSSSSTHSVVGKKGMMRIEVPKRNNESFLKVDEESTGSPGNLARTPGGGRILSIKRILGRQRSWRGASNNSTATTPLSCSCRSATAVMDDEEGQDQERQSSSSSSSRVFSSSFDAERCEGLRAPPME
ncbi:hypothetical protein Syun_007956 [Stephania yunnanensis]|uniref:RING-type E3 ubiquitin transferase n=1 Tax=Stephania yunnanensis TaxID=152371 RepID=A0AAP0L0H4_9MAGN